MEEKYKEEPYIDGMKSYMYLVHCECMEDFYTEWKFTVVKGRFHW